MVENGCIRKLIQLLYQEIVLLLGAPVLGSHQFICHELVDLGGT